MDIISKAIISAVNTASPTKEAAAAYKTLKELILKNDAATGDLADALDKLEKKPDSTGRQAMLGEEILAARISLNPDIKAAAQNLLNKLAAPPRSEQPATAPTIPLQKPPRPKHMVGRPAELDQIAARLTPGQVLSLCGPTGIGKSALATAVLWHMAPRHKPPDLFPDGIIYHSFYTQPRTDIVLEEIARIFGEEPIPSPYEAAQRALANRKILLVLDGGEQSDDLAGVLAIRGNCGVLITSRTCPDEVTNPYEITPLPPEAAIKFLQDWGGRINPDVAGRICELLGYLPLAIRLVGHHLAAQNLNAADYLDWLRGTALPSLTPAQRQQDCLPLVIENSLAQISESARQALAIIGLLSPVPFDQEVIAKTLTIQPSHGLFSAIRGLFKAQPARQQVPQVRMALRELGNYGLLWGVDGLYQVSHPFIHAYIQKRLTPPPKSIRRLATYFMALAWEQSTPVVNSELLLDTNRPHFMRVMSECVEWKEWEAAHGLAAAIEDYLDRQGFLADRVTANEIGLIAAWQLGRPSEGAWLGNLGDTYRTMGHAKWAIEHFEKALITARQSGDRHGEGNSLGNLGLAHRDLGQIEQAIDYLKQARAIFEEIRSPSASLVKDWLLELEEWDEA